MDQSAAKPYLPCNSSISQVRSGATARKDSRRCQLTRRNKPGTRQAAMVDSHCLSATPPAWNEGLRASYTTSACPLAGSTEPPGLRTAASALRAS